MANNEVAKKENGAKVPISMADVEKYAGAGFEEATSDSYAIPFLQILQKMSDQTDPENASYINGAKAGMFANLTTGKLVDGKKGISFLNDDLSPHNKIFSNSSLLTFPNNKFLNIFSTKIFKEYGKFLIWGWYLVNSVKLKQVTSPEEVFIICLIWCK